MASGEQSTMRTAPPASMTPRELDPDAVMIFVRAECFYPVQGVKGVPLAEQAAEHAALNPGTLRVEDMGGNILWRLQ